MNSIIKSALASAALLTLSTPASAAIIIVSASSIQGDNVLFNSGTQTGTTVTGATQNGTLVNFTGTTIAGTTLTANGGQARVETDLTSLNFSLADGSSFNDVEFNLFNRSSRAATASFSLISNLGTTYTFTNLALGNGGEFFGFQGTGGELIKSVSWTINGGSVQDQRQLRLTRVATAVPEPATWATMFVGFAALGAGMRRRSSAKARVRYAV